MVRMTEDILHKRSETRKQEGCRKLGRPHLRWKECVKRDLRKAEEEEKWRENAKQQGRMERNYYKSSGTSEGQIYQPHAYKKGKPEEEHVLRLQTFN